MRRPRIFQNQTLKINDIIDLQTQAAVHVSRVLRLQQGNELVIFNGIGGEYIGVIVQLSKRDVRVELRQYIDRSVESPLDIVLAQGISKGERMDLTVQKAVELGVNRIIPLITQHSVVNLSEERKQKRRLHWQTVARSACEQCARNIVPLVEDVQPISKWIALAQTGTKLILDHRAETSLHALKVDTGKPILALIGPEGGWSDEELEQATKSGFTAISLGPRVLRTETASLAFLSAIQTLWGDFY